jgi:hypothetical protein
MIQSARRGHRSWWSWRNLLKARDPLSQLPWRHHFSDWKRKWYLCEFLLILIICLKIAGFVDPVHLLEFKITRKHKISESRSVSVFMGSDTDTYSVGSLLDWRWSLTLSKGPNRLVVSLPLPEYENRSSFWNVVSSSCLEFWTMEKIHKPF